MALIRRYAVDVMNQIITLAEKRITPVNPMDLTSPKRMIVEVTGDLVYSAVTLLPEKIDGIITATRSGFTTRWISKFRPPCQIYAVTKNPAVMLRMRLLWGVFPVGYHVDVDSVADLVRDSVRTVYAQGFIDRNKDIVFTSGTKYVGSRTNVLGVFHVRDLLDERQASEN